ncbi:MAG: hypothetical protein H7836_16165 [Magnetococcus sp. YQC-3]
MNLKNLTNVKKEETNVKLPKIEPIEKKPEVRKPLKSVDIDNIKKARQEKLLSQQKELKTKFYNNIMDEIQSQSESEYDDDTEVIDLEETEEDKLWDEYYSNAYNIKTSKNDGLVDFCKKRNNYLEQNELYKYFKK